MQVTKQLKEWVIVGYDKGEMPEPCEYAGSCDAYDEGFYTCTRDKKSCNTWMLFACGKITRFKTRL